MPRRDSFFGTILVAAVLCVVCSAVVSIAAVSLRPRQEENKRLDRQRNVLDATGLAMGEFGRPAGELTRVEVDELYAWVSEELVDLKTGEYTDEFDTLSYEPREVVDDPQKSIEIEDPKYDLGENRRPEVMKVFLVRRPGEEELRQVVLPVYGKGLWSTLYGYLAIKSDLETIQGLTFYEHGETPGLGGEVDNPNWKRQWEGKKLYDDEGEPAAGLAKNAAPPDDPYRVDGLSGATITARGVTNLIRYWTSEDGYRAYLENLKSGNASGADSEDGSDTESGSDDASQAEGDSEADAKDTGA